MNPMIIATAEMYINAQVSTIKECMEKGVPHDEIIAMSFETLRETCSEEPDANEANKYVCLLLSRTLYHLASTQSQNQN